MSNPPAIGTWTENGYVVDATDTHLLVEDGNGNDDPRWIERETTSTARIIVSEADPQNGVRYTLKHTDGRDQWEEDESYSPELLWAEWQMGTVDWTPF